MVTTAWADVQARFSPLAIAKSLPVPQYAFGGRDWFSRMKYPALFLTVDYARQETESMLGEELRVALDLVLVQTAAKPETLQAQILGYTDAMLELIRDDHTLGGACQIGEFVASDLYAGAADGPDLAIAMMSILLRKEIQI